MNIDFLSVLADALGILVSAVVSWLIAKHASLAEIKKLKTTWDHEKQIATDEDFDKMVSAVSSYIRRSSTNAYTAAVAAVAVFRAKSVGEMADAVDRLDKAFACRSENTSNIEAALTAVIEQRRNTCS